MTSRQRNLAILRHNTLARVRDQARTDAVEAYATQIENLVEGLIAAGLPGADNDEDAMVLANEYRSAFLEALRKELI